MTSENEEDDSSELTADNIRSSLRQYPARKINPLLQIPLYLLQTYAATLEIFLHREFGERYLGWLRCVVGFIMLYFLAALIPPYDFTMNSNELSLPFSQYIPGMEIPIPLIPKREVFGINIVPIVLTIYYSFAQWRLLEIFINNRFNTPSHPRSSGESYRMWDRLYILLHKLNFQVDLIKQLCEPLIILVLGVILILPTLVFYLRLLANLQGAPPGIGIMILVEGIKAHTPGEAFLAFWLLTGGIALSLKAYIENQGRKRFTSRPHRQ